MIFRDRRDAGKKLAQALHHFTKKPHTLIFALPRGGVPVAFEVAKALQLPLDIFLVRKLGVPDEEELAMGAIGMGGVLILNQDIIDHLRLSSETIERVKAKETRILEERNQRYREGRPLPDVSDKTVILIDDGIATGATMRVAIVAIKQLGCAHLIVAVPVAPAATVGEITNEADAVFALQQPDPFYAIGNWYQDFSQTSDEEMRFLLQEARDL